MEFQRPQYCLCFVLFSLLSYCSQAYVFYPGGRDGWVVNPSEDYNHWAERNRFQVNDTMVFKYKKGSNSVLVVNKEGYYKCDKTNPIKKFEDGDSVFKFDQSGPFYFISGTDSYCEKGQKLIVVVLAIRPPPPPSSVWPPPGSKPPAVSPHPSYPAPMIPPTSPPTPAVSPYPSPKISPSSPAPAVSPYPSPNISPSSPSPAITPPAVSPAPANVPSYPTPGSAPAPASTSPPPPPANTPANSPTSPPSPAPSTPGSSPPAPPANTPASGPGSPATPSASPPGSANPSSSNETSPPPPNGSGAWDVAPSSLLVYAGTIVLSCALSEILGGQ
ncbi:early nodulin-like protein 2 [Neltuma alba]|uniref:early nodulin-like protein 2 n=1 Tax=Neltuma alba TaxID=207710 RepID=UPI0010A3DE93|nr:early nodulin-like protein 2 [Prosopis alba]XP_028794646.1 early nodulin-like protein 2 [Prosopis alba]XP_028794647.1 early nodulin-like protein 2 [Prosopis alba]